MRTARSCKSGWALIALGLILAGCSRAAPESSTPEGAAGAPESVGASRTAPSSETPETPGTRNAAAPGTDPNAPSVPVHPASNTAGTPDVQPAGPVAPGNPGTATAGGPPAPFNLFAPPKIDVPVVHQSEQREEDEAVRLIGFVDVGAMKALLAFDGKIRGMEAGAVHANVEVVAIDPPRVTLQRGRERWITALFEQPVVNQQGRDHAGRSAGPQVTIGQQSSAGGQRSGGPSMFGGPGRRGAAGEWPGMSSGAGPGALNPPGAIGLPPLPGLPGEGDAGQSGGTDGSPTVPGLPGIPLPGAGTGPPTP